MIFLVITSTILFLGAAFLLFRLRYIKTAVISGIIAFLYLLVSISIYIILFKENSFNGEKVLKIEMGTAFTKIMDTLEEEKIIDSRTMFKYAAYVLNLDQKLKAGKYKFTPGLSNYDILKKLEKCDYVIESVTLPEGITLKQMAAILKEKLEINDNRFLELCSDGKFISGLGLEYDSLEGFLFPDTYYIAWGTPESEIIKILVGQFNSVFEKLNGSSKMYEKYNKHEIVTMASLVEGEAMLDEEKGTIAGVFYNRLQKRIRLAADPTIQYIIPDGPRRLLNDDLKIDSPYNTYLHYGLPPGPINNPGETSLKAALFPEETDYLYFVANGEGGHKFSRTMQEHLDAKKEFDKIRRAVRRAQRYGKKN